MDRMSILISKFGMISSKMKFDDTKEFPLSILPRGEYEKAIKIGKEMIIEGITPDDSRVPNNLGLAMSMAYLLKKERRDDLFSELKQEPGRLLRSDFLRKMGTLGFFVFYEVYGDRHVSALRSLKKATEFITERNSANGY